MQWFSFTFFQGYFRRGEVEFAANLFGRALESYRRASQLQNDPTLLECVLKANRELSRQQKVSMVIVNVVLHILKVALNPPDSDADFSTPYFSGEKKCICVTLIQKFYTIHTFHCSFTQFMPASAISHNFSFTWFTPAATVSC